MSSGKSAHTPWWCTCEKPYTIGIIAARIVHWWILLDTMFMSAMGARVTRRAQLNVETNSENSERNGATHWTRKNWLIPTTVASAIIEFRNGCAVTYNNTPPTPNNPP